MLEETLQSLINPKKRFRAIPKIFYFMLKEKHLEASTSVEGTTVRLSFMPGEDFLQVSTDFLQTFKDYGFGDLAQNGFSMVGSLTLDKVASLIGRYITSRTAHLSLL